MRLCRNIKLAYLQGNAILQQMNNNHVFYEF